MRFCFVVLLIVATLQAIVDAASAATESKLTTSDFRVRAYPDNLHEVPSTRLLRVDDEAEGESDEERAISIPGVSNLKNWLMTQWLKLKSWFANRKQLQGWKKEEKTPDEVFKLLKLDEGADTLMANPKLDLWMKYMRMYNKKNPTKMVNMLGLLTKTYGDEAVAKMLETARRNPSTYKIADALQGRQLVGWVQNGLSTDIVFQLLKVDEGSVGKLFSNPAFNVWYYFFTRANRYNPDREVNMIKKLLTVYDDIPLAKAIEAARKVKTTGELPRNVQSIENIATNFQNAQFKKWFADGVDPPTIFTRLKMDKLDWGLDPNAEIFRGYRTFYKANKAQI